MQYLFTFTLFTALSSCSQSVPLLNWIPSQCEFSAAPSLQLLNAFHRYSITFHAASSSVVVLTNAPWHRGGPSLVALQTYCVCVTFCQIQVVQVISVFFHDCSRSDDRTHHPSFNIYLPLCGSRTGRAGLTVCERRRWTAAQPEPGACRKAEQRRINQYTQHVQWLYSSCDILRLNRCSPASFKMPLLLTCCIINRHEASLCATDGMFPTLEMLTLIYTRSNVTSIS